MDGIFDLGGRQGFGKPSIADNKGFKEHWELRINAITGFLVRQKIYNMDEYRHAIERMDPRHYMSASYYERVYTAVVTLCIEKGIFTAAELNAAAGEHVPLANPSAPGRAAPVTLPDLAVGDLVRVKNDFVAGHMRMPAYIRGKTGRIVGKRPRYPYPDAAAHGIESEKQHNFDVRFNSSDLWPDGSEASEVNVGVFHAYLDKIA